jgi:hypothetical protein
MTQTLGRARCSQNHETQLFMLPATLQQKDKLVVHLLLQVVRYLGQLHTTQRYVKRSSSQTKTNPTSHTPAQCQPQQDFVTTSQP